jgi:hypothetical protein
VEGVDRGQSTLFPALLDDYVAEDNPVRAVDVFVDGLDLDKLGFLGVQPLDTGRPGYHPLVMLKLGGRTRTIAGRARVLDLQPIPRWPRPVGGGETLRD